MFLEHRFALLIFKGDIIKYNITFYLTDFDCSDSSIIFRCHIHQFLGAVKAGKGFRKLTADVAHLYDWSNHKTQVKGKGKEITKGHFILE